ncbi:hypothetical protein [Sphingosinicella microcystinivorans]|uniref:hypothetical protein n=1 Tax=Sphingosinicella microcystinivorans TaxID=335406 RepID=UPI0022F3CC3F|nr:hypothetical protein [Sphingosinicella microcystinivorans]WBX85690.1 hypothetical protein PE061_07210 [Sphingosinicella microcystinivorans]
MSARRCWIALVTFERRGEPQNILPEEVQGACGWMIAMAPDEDAARALLIRDVEYNGLRVLEISDEQEIFEIGEIEGIDEHLAASFTEIEADRRTVWGTIHHYKGEGEA